MRPAGQALAGFYETQDDVLPSIAAFLRIGHHADTDDVSVVDPCIADGKAITAVLRDIYQRENDAPHYRLFGAELEKTKADAIRHRYTPDMTTTVVHGDALNVTWEGHAGLLWLNPPYDQGRLEAQWLDRFAPILAESGILVLIVPFTSLAHCAATIATHFEDVRAYRYPFPVFSEHKQCVLFGKKTAPLRVPNDLLVAKLKGWASDVSTMDALPTPEQTSPLYAIPSEEHYQDGCSALGHWDAHPLDLVALGESFVPWRTTTKTRKLVPVPGILPANGLAGFERQTFPVGMALRPGHVAAALACGVFNGVHLAPNATHAHLPTILFRVTYTRNWETTGYISNSEGEITKAQQVQVAGIRAMALDLGAGTYHEIESSTERSPMTSLAGMTLADVLDAYGDALRAAVAEQCPAYYDPATAPTIPPLARALMDAQVEVVRASATLIQTNGAALVMGSTGTGKTTMGTAIAATLGARRVLVTCPPHLLSTWRREVAATLPAARTVVINDIHDADAFVVAPDEGMVIGIVAETTGKLSHGWAEVPRCGKCGTPTKDKADAVKKRARCSYTPWEDDELTTAVTDLASIVAPFAPDLLGYMRERRVVEHLERTGPLPPSTWQERRARLRPLVYRFAKLTGRAMIIKLLLVAIGDDDLTANVALRCAKSNNTKDACAVVQLMAPGSAKQLATLDQLQAHREIAVATRSDEGRSWGHGVEHSPYLDKVARANISALCAGDGGLPVDDEPLSGSIQQPVHYGFVRGTVDAAIKALRIAGTLASAGETCGEPLYQAAPTPRRVPVIDYLMQKRRPVPGSRRRGAKRIKQNGSPFDLVIVDEIHRFSNADAATGAALAKFQGVPLLGLSGSMMNGYAKSLFHILYVFSAYLRATYGRNEEARFQRQYGFSSRTVDIKELDRDQGDVVEYGSQSNRVQRKAAPTKAAPGVVPSLLMEHLLRVGGVIHLEDLGIDLPPIEEHVIEVPTRDDVLNPVKAFRRTLAETIKAHRKDGFGKALFGAMANEWGNVDLIPGVGNEDDHVCRARWPESSYLGTLAGSVVCELGMLPEETLLDKETKLVELVKAELAEGRQCLITVWHSSQGLPQRIGRIVGEAIGRNVPVLSPSKVSSRDRDDWIRAKVVAAGEPVLVVQPASVETGLNSLVYFPTLIHYQLPGADPRVALQVEGRIRRPGQHRPQRVYWLVASGTSQQRLRSLVLHKRAEIEAVHALDPASSMEAAGIGAAPGMTGFDVGRQLYLAALEG